MTKIYLLLLEKMINEVGKITNILKIYFNAFDLHRRIDNTTNADRNASPKLNIPKYPQKRTKS